MKLLLFQPLSHLLCSLPAAGCQRPVEIRSVFLAPIRLGMPHDDQPVFLHRWYKNVFTN